MRVPEHGPKGEDGLVLGHLCLEPGQLPVADLVLLAAGHRALEAGGVPVVIVRVHLLAGDGERLGEGFLAEIVGAERSQRIDGLDEKRRAVGGQRLGPRRHRLAPLLDEGLERRRVGQLRLARPRHRHRLHVLGAQHRADAPAARHAFAVLPVGGQRREPDALLARGTDGHHVRARALDLLHGVDGVAGGPAPEVTRGLEGGAVLGDAEIDGLLRAAGDHHRVETGALHGRRESAAEGGVEEEPGQRRFRGDAGAAIAGHAGIGDRAHREDHGIRRVVGIDPGRRVIDQKPGGEAVAAEKRPRLFFPHRLDARRAGSRVHEEDSPAVASHRAPMIPERAGQFAPRALSSLRAASASSGSAPFAVASFRYTTTAASLCLSATKDCPAPSSARWPHRDSGAR